MSNASRAKATAARYGRLAETAPDTARKGAYQKLEQLWSEMAALAEKFDRRKDESVKARIYEMMDAVEVARHQAA